MSQPVPFGAVVVTAALLALGGAAIAAAHDGAAETALHDGDYQRAAQLGRAAGTARGSVTAALAELAQGEFLVPGEDRLRVFADAEQDARHALSLDAGEVDGHLALAVALGFIGRQEGYLTAHFEGRAHDARQQIDIALALEPRNPWANALFGGWNLEIVSDGGAIGGEIYGATLADGTAAYTRALTLDPGNSQIAYQYALELLALGGEAQRDAAKRLLAGIVTHSPADALDALIRNRAIAMAGALDARDEEKLAGLLQDQMGSRP